MCVCVCVCGGGGGGEYCTFVVSLTFNAVETGK